MPDPRILPELARSLRAMEAKRFVDWAFGHYLEVAHPQFVASGAPAPVTAPAAA